MFFFFRRKLFIYNNKTCRHMPYHILLFDKPTICSFTKRNEHMNVHEYPNICLLFTFSFFSMSTYYLAMAEHLLSNSRAFRSHSCDENWINGWWSDMCFVSIEMKAITLSIIHFIIWNWASHVFMKYICWQSERYQKKKKMEEENTWMKSNFFPRIFHYFPNRL